MKDDFLKDNMSSGLNKKPGDEHQAFLKTIQNKNADYYRALSNSNTTSISPSGVTLIVL